uniref:HA domain-containing protein n=1 Tax=Gongylonema pulchrum TaxID=637853 RepID=A0A183D8I4_9BILA
LNTSTVNFDSDSSSDYYDEKWDKMTRYLEFQEAYCNPSKYRGRCDPNNPELIEWFAKRKLTKRLENWGQMIVN